MRLRNVLFVIGGIVVLGCGGSNLPYVPAGGGGGGGGVSNFSLNGGGTQTINPGGTANFNVDVGLGGQTAAAQRTPLAVTLSAIGLPANATPSFSPNPVVPNNPSRVSVLTVTTTAAVVPGTYNFTIRGTDGVNTRTLGATLVVNAQGDRFVLAAEALDDQMTNQGGPITDDPVANYRITVTAPQGYAGNARLEWRFLGQGSPTEADILGAWHYGLEQSGTTLEYTIGADNLTDAAECTLQRQRNMTLHGTFQVEFRVVPLAAGFAPETFVRTLTVIDNGAVTRPR